MSGSRRTEWRQGTLFGDGTMTEAARGGKSRAEKFLDYRAFTDKFKPRKTTDDCYTPPAVYEAVVRFVDRRLAPLAGREVVRPFRPGGDYEAEEYPEGCVVVDNPPFSIFARIVRFYEARRVPFFLFAPSLTLFGILRGTERTTAVVCGASVTYENGAVVRTSFATDLWPGHPLFAVSGTLTGEIEAAAKGKPKERAALRFPPEVATAAQLMKIAMRGVDFECPRGEGAFVAGLDNHRAGLYGGGVLMSERMAERTATVVELSTKEKRIVAELGG